jgi:hypothetical protein
MSADDAISATVGALPRSCHIVETVRLTRIAVSCTFRGTRSAQPRSRKWRFSSPTMVAAA